MISKEIKHGIPAKVFSIEYDPNRTSRIALLHYADGEKRYILAPEGLKVGDKVISGPGSDITVGNALPLKDMPLAVLYTMLNLNPVKAVSLDDVPGFYSGNGKGRRLCST